MLKQMYFAASCTIEFGGNNSLKEKGYYYSDLNFFLPLKSTTLDMLVTCQGLSVDTTVRVTQSYISCIMWKNAFVCLWCPGTVENIDHTLQVMKAFGAFSCTPIRSSGQVTLAEFVLQ